ncbi:MAG: outer membrane beta-barrel protein [Vicinamibacterales bacterium]
MRAAVVLTLAFLAAASPVLAQSAPPRGQVAGVVGAGRTWDDEGSIGTGIAAGARVDWRVFRNTSVEGALDVLTHNRTSGAFEAEGTSTILSVSLLHRFGRRSVRPYILEGAHIIRHSGTTRFSGIASDRRSADPGFHLGAGFGMRITDRIEIGPEGRFYFIRPADGSAPAWVYWIGLRVGLGI